MTNPNPHQTYSDEQIIALSRLVREEIRGGVRLKEFLHALWHKSIKDAELGAPQDAALALQYSRAISQIHGLLFDPRTGKQETEPLTH